VQPDLPAEISQFLIRYVNSVTELEGLLLMRRETQEPWSAAVLAKRLYVTEQTGGLILEVLHRHGFTERIAESPTKLYCYKPKTETLSAAVAQTAEFYAKFLIPVTNFLHANRSRAVQQFADAFRLKEK
jgi:hypothetical protein